MSRPPKIAAKSVGTADETLSEEWTYEQLVKTLCDHLLVMMHGILYARGIYRREFFSEMRVYGMGGWIASHPAIREYLDDCVDSVHAEMRRGSLRTVEIILLSPASGDPLTLPPETPMERYVFDYSALPIISQDLLKLPLRNLHRDKVHPHAQLEAQFRASLVRLSVVTAQLGKLPGSAGDGSEGSATFGVVLELKDEVGSPGDLDRWVVDGDGRRVGQADPIALPAEILPTTDSQVENDEHHTMKAKRAPWTKGKAMKPLKTIDFASLKFQAWVEETLAKRKMREDPPPFAGDGASRGTDEAGPSGVSGSGNHRVSQGSSLGKRRLEDVSF
ncbi:hypothetical protein PYCC9005_005974 [Savitreella phatthalungensis]